MKTPISEILDKYSIALLKKDRANADNDKEINELELEIEKYKIDNEKFINDKISELVTINGMIWNLEFDIRRGKEEMLGLIEVGRRAIEIRDLNKKRIRSKNEIIDKFNEGYKDIKINHASSDE